MDRQIRSSKNPQLLISGIIGFVIIAAFVNLVPPDSLWKIAAFFILFTISTGFILQYVFRRVKLSILFSCGASLLLILRFFDLKSPLYVILLIACIIAITIMWKRK